MCNHCGHIAYVNPKIVVGAVAVQSDAGEPFGPDAVALSEVRVLLCRRAIMPRRGWWTLPAGFMEEGETLAAGTCREAREEAGCELKLDALLAVYDIPGRSQVQIMHRACVTSDISAGPESLEVALFPWAEIPWKSLAFHSVSWALMDFERSREQASFAPFRNPPGAPGWRSPAGWQGPAAG